jgi:hypothetical protein
MGKGMMIVHCSGKPAFCCCVILRIEETQNYIVPGKALHTVCSTVDREYAER